MYRTTDWQVGPCQTKSQGRPANKSNSTFTWEWKPLPHDPSILNAVREYKIDFLFTPIQSTISTTINFSAQGSKNVNEQISKFLEKGITVKMYDPEVKGS